MLFLVRAQEQCESEEQATVAGMLPVWRLINSLKAEQLTSVTQLSSSDAAARRTAIFNVSRFCIEQPMVGRNRQSLSL